jgi:serine/threonine protein kinase
MTFESVRLTEIGGIGSRARPGGGYAGAPPASSASRVGRRLGPYRLLERVGTGAYAAVYRGRHEVLGVERAIKVPRPSLAAWPEQRDRFLREARVAARLRHPNVVSVHDCGTASDGTPYIVMDLVTGRSLADRLAEGVPPPGEMLRVAGQIALALDHAHGAGVVHRDVKPANVLLAGDGTAQLGDFGIAHLGREPQPGEADADAGTPAYMAPEQRRGQRAGLGPHTDVYGLAAVLYEMLTGRPPRADDPDGPPPPPSAVNPYLPAGVDQVLARGLAAEPMSRQPTASALVAELAPAVGSGGDWAPLALAGAPTGRAAGTCDRTTTAPPLARDARPLAAAPREGGRGLIGRWRR